MTTLAIEFGGHKFSIAELDGDRMIRRKSDSTDREGGRDWMLARIVGIANEWQRELKFDCCGIGFGGPVDFAGQRVFHSTHVGGWGDFPLRDARQCTLVLPAIMVNDANMGARGEARYGAGPGATSTFFLPQWTGVGAWTST